MDRVAVFVDAGYLFAAGSIAIAGERLPRGRLALDYSAIVRSLEGVARQRSSLPLLRIYWYDGTSTGPTQQHLALGYRDGLKVRLGFVNSQGAQKGVDSLIVTDMIDLARNRAMTDAVLLSGDEDLRVGVQQAQSLGVRVHLVGIEPSRRNQSGFLVQEADSTLEWGRSDVEAFLAVNDASDKPTSPARSPGAPVESTSAVSDRAEPAELSGVARWEDTLREVSVEVAGSLARAEVEALVQSASRIPKEIDRRLLVRASESLGTSLDGSQKRAVRSRFIAECVRLLRSPSTIRES